MKGSINAEAWAMLDKSRDRIMAEQRREKAQMDKVLALHAQAMAQTTPPTSAKSDEPDTRRYKQGKD